MNYRAPWHPGTKLPGDMMRITADLADLAVGRSLNPWQSLRCTAEITAVMIAPVSRCCL